MNLRKRKCQNYFQTPARITKRKSNFSNQLNVEVIPANTNPSTFCSKINSRRQSTKISKPNVKSNKSQEISINKLHYSGIDLTTDFENSNNIANKNSSDHRLFDFSTSSSTREIIKSDNESEFSQPSTSKPAENRSKSLKEHKRKSTKKDENKIKEQDKEDQETTSYRKISFKDDEFHQVLIKYFKQEYFLNFNDVLERFCQGTVTKINDGGFSEIYGLLVDKVLKVIRIDKKLSLKKLIPEICLNYLLTNLKDGGFFHNFGTFDYCCLAEGEYPLSLVNAWEEFKKEKTKKKIKREYGTNPSKFKKVDEYVLMFSANFGRGLDACEETLYGCEALSIFKQVLLSVAIGEEKLMLEHRDLHHGNVLFKITKAKSFKYIVGNQIYEVDTDGVQATIIDYSLSRFTTDDIEVFLNLEEHGKIFKKQDDDDDQCLAYRKMRSLTKKKWNMYCPQTNVIWMQFLAQKLAASIDKDNEIDFVKLLKQWSDAMKNKESCKACLEIVFPPKKQGRKSLK